MRYFFLLLFMICFSIWADTPHFAFVKVTPTETELSALPPTAHGIFTFESSGFEPGKKYTLYSQGLEQEKVKLFGCMGSENGSLMYCKGKTSIPLNSINQILNDFMPGESVQFLLISQDKKDEIKAKVIPNPLEVKDKNGRCLAMELLDDTCMNFLVTISQFTPDEDIQFFARSGKEVKVGKYKISKDGSLKVRFSSEAKEAKAGRGFLQIIAESGDKLSLNYDWGRA